MHGWQPCECWVHLPVGSWPLWRVCPVPLPQVIWLVPCPEGYAWLFHHRMLAPPWCLAGRLLLRNFFLEESCRIKRRDTQTFSNFSFFPSNARWLSPGRLSSRKDNCIVQIHRINAVATLVIIKRSQTSNVLKLLKLLQKNSQALKTFFQLLQIKRLQLKLTNTLQNSYPIQSQHQVPRT